MTEIGGGKRSCLYLGLGGCAVIVLVGLVLGFLAVRLITDRFASITDEAPRDIPEVLATDEEHAALQQRLDEFAANAKEGVAEPLRLTDDQINVLLQRSPQWAALSEMIYVSFLEDAARVELSLPLGQYAPGRWLNGSAELKPSVEEGKLRLELLAAETNGQSLPPYIMRNFQDADLFDVFREQGAPIPAGGVDVPDYIQSIEIEEGALVLMPKAGAAEPQPATI
jgi:hypothetical protein